MEDKVAGLVLLDTLLFWCLELIFISFSLLCPRLLLLVLAMFHSGAGLRMNDNEALVEELVVEASKEELEVEVWAGNLVDNGFWVTG